MDREPRAPSLTLETFEVAVREYNTCLQLQQRLYEPVSRLIAETYPHRGPTAEGRVSLASVRSA